MLNAEVEIGKATSEWCNLANIAFRCGKPMTQDDAARVAAAGASAGKPWQDILASAEKTLGTHGISMIDSEIRVSPTMTFDGDKCQFVGEMAELGNSFIKREYRAPFVVPEIV